MAFGDLARALGSAAKAAAQFVQTDPILTRRVPWVDGDGNWQLSDQFIHEVMALSPSQMWRRQPHLRTVVSFMARNISQLGLHTFDRVSDTDRQRMTDDVTARLFRYPNPYNTRTELFYALVSDYALHDVAYWWLTPADSPSKWQIMPILASWVKGTKGGDAYQPDYYVITGPSGKSVDVPADQVVVFRGWDPLSPSCSTSPVVTLKEILLEQISALVYRNQVWKRGGRVGQVITRPAGHNWTEQQETRFLKAFRAAYSGNEGPEAGGVPILQDGMTIQRVGFSAKEEEFVAGTKLALSSVASVYHINPAMVGVLDNANYSNMKEFNKGLYGQTLGHPITSIEDRINTFVLPKIGASPTGYVEFNVAEKLKGSFEERASVMSTSIGGPWLTVNEGRALDNRAPLPGGDDLIVPLNVTQGGQASPQSGKSAPIIVRSVTWPDRKAIDAVPLRHKAAPADDAVTEFETALSAFWAHQGKAVLSAIGAKARKSNSDPSWWDSERWDKELAGILAALGLVWATESGKSAAESLGFDPDLYDVERTGAFVDAVAESRASMINAVTLRQLSDVIDAGDPEQPPASVFEQAKRAAVAALTIATTYAAFGATEAGKQLAGDTATKTWVVNSPRPRAAHAAMNGKTVPVGEKFGNGADWPGDPVLGAEGTAGCHCSVELSA